MTGSPKANKDQALLDAVKTEEWYRHQAQMISSRWDTRLDHFELPCPLCKGQLQFQGARRSPIYEFAEGEPGTVNALNVLVISFVCNRCGYLAEFDAELFNPAYLAQLQGAEPERIVELTVREFRVLVPLTGEERSQTLLELASALAGVRHGEVLVLNVAPDAATGDQLSDKLQHYKPAIGDPAVVNLLRQHTEHIGEAIVSAANRQRCDLLMVGWRGWTRNQQAIMGTVLDPVLNEAACDIAVVHDRGLHKVNRILLSISGGPNARAAAQLAFDLARAFGAELHVLSVVAPNNPDAEAEGQAQINNAMRDLPADDAVSVDRRVVTATNAVQTIVDESSNYDLMVIGAARRNWLGRIRRNNTVARIVRNASPTAVVVSTRQSRITSWFSRLFT